MLKTFTLPPSERCFEDYTVGAIYYCGSFAMSEDEMVAFASQYDPQAMHIDRALASAGPFGGVIASGWHTVARAMRLLVDHFLPHNGLAAPGIDELRWPRPVRPGQTLTLFATVQEARRSQSKPDRGLVRTLLELKDESGEVVMSMRPTNFIRVRTIV